MRESVRKERKNSGNFKKNWEMKWNEMKNSRGKEGKEEIEVGWKEIKLKKRKLKW